MIPIAKPLLERVKTKVMEVLESGILASSLCGGV